MTQDIYNDICVDEIDTVKSETDSNKDKNSDNNNKIFLFIFSLLPIVQKYIANSSSQSQLFILLIFYTTFIAGISYYGGTLSCKL